MTAVVPIRAERSTRALPAPIAPLVGVDNTLALVAQAAETIRRLQEARIEADARAKAAFEQMQADRVDWKAEWDRLTREAHDARQLLAASEANITEAQAEYKTVWRRCGEAETREAATLARAEQAEARARTAEEWLSRLHETVVSEFATILDQAPA